MASAGSTVSDDGGLGAALRNARLAEGAHYEAAQNLRDAKSIRLQLLKDDLSTAAAAAGGLFDLALAPGDPPRLWIDLITAVVMEPDHRTYRLQQDRQSGREILFESDDRALMADTVRRHMAHLMVARERLAATAVLPPPPAGYSMASLLLAWLSGLALGALALMSVAIYLDRMGF